MVSTGVSPLDIAIRKGAGGSLPGAATWNPADKGSELVLSNGNLAVSGTGVYSGGTVVRSTNSHNAGKYYLETQFSDPTPGQIGSGELAAIGFATASFTGVATDPPWLGLDAEAVGVWDNLWTYVGGVNLAGTPPAFGDNDWALLAIDIDAGLLWIGVNGVFVGNPELGTGGMDVSAICVGGVFAACLAYVPTTVLTTNFGAFAWLPPTGFLAWDS